MTGPVVEFSDDFDAVGFYMDRMARYDDLDEWEMYEGTE